MRRPRFWHKQLALPQDVFTEQELERIRQSVQDAEALTSGEICVIVRASCEKGLSTREQALKEFRVSGLEKTRDRTGVLLLILLREKKVEVLGDQGINDKVPEGTWEHVVHTVVMGFEEGMPCDGVCMAVVEVGSLLANEFPKKPDDMNELPDSVTLR